MRSTIVIVVMQLFLTKASAQSFFFKTIHIPALQKNVDNYVQCVPLRFGCDKISFSIDNGKVQQTGCDLIVTPDRDGIATVYVWKAGKKIDSSFFRVEAIQPKVFIGRFENGEIFKSYLKAVGGISVIAAVGGCSIDVTLQKVTVLLYRNNELIAQSVQTGSLYTAETMKLIDQSINGDFFVLINIKASYSNNEEVLLQPLQLTICE